MYGTMVGIEYLLSKNMCYVVQKWLKTLDFGMNSDFRGTKFKPKIDGNQFLIASL